MSSENLVRVEFGRSAKQNDQIIYKDLNAQAVNIIGTAFKGPAFVPQVMWNQAVSGGVEVRNTFINLLGTHRQNFRAHLYDDYLCYADSDAYDAASIWFANGGEYAYFTRVLGIGSGVRDDTTGKMIGSGFNLAKDISSGTLTNKIDKNLNAIDSEEEGSIGFVIKQINEVSAGSNVVNSNITSNLNYLSELGIDSSENPYILTDVYMFASGVLPELDEIDETNSTFDGVVSHSADNLKTIKLKNIIQYNKKHKDSINRNGNFQFEVIDLQTEFDIVDTIESYRNLKNGHEESTNKKPNHFFEDFSEKGHVLYAKYPTNGLFSFSTAGKNVTLLNSRLKEDAESEYPDYNSFECEYQTAKTPWITSDPLSREGLGDNRKEIHDKVINLFRFWSLDDGDIGNRFRIKINIKECGDIDYVKPNKSDPNYTKLNESGLFYAKFDVYIFEYDPRVDDYINISVPDYSTQDRQFGPVEVFKNLNLNPDSQNYIGRVIGTEHTYYDFGADRLVTKGIHKNRSNYVRVELTDEIENKSYDTETGPQQHMFLPSGFRSYPHLNINKDAFLHYTNSNKGINISDTFDTNGVYHLPPQYALNYYNDEVLDASTGIQNNWGVLFNTSSVNNNNKLVRHDDVAISTGKFMSPHYYYSKYFLSGIYELDDEGNSIQSETKNVWIEEENYLNSFFHLEKIVYNSEKSERVLTSDFTDISSTPNILYKHSGRPVTGNNTYINLSYDNSDIWNEEDRKLNVKFRNMLSFDFFTYGGFDGVDLRDSDKRFLRNDSLIRELSDEEPGSSSNGATLNAYNKAIDIATDNANSASDILIVPGIKEIPLIRKCIDICESTKTQFFIGDVSGACSGFEVNFVNYTDNDKIAFVSLGKMGQQVIFDNELNSTYVRDSSKTRTDNRFVLTKENVPDEGDILKFYNYREVVKRQFENILSNWSVFDIESKYFLPVLGDLLVNQTYDDGRFINKKVCPEVFVLGLMARNTLRSSLVNTQSPSFLEFPNMSIKLINERDFSEKSQNFEIVANRAKKAGINLLYRSTQSESVKLLTQNTAYGIRGSIFKDQGVIRTLNQIKKRILFDIFLNETLVEGGFFFAQNSNLNNLYQKLDIQINTLLSKFVQEGLINDFKVRIPKSTDDQAILDMQNYILRGTVILQMNNSDIIDLTLDEILQDLSLTADPVNGAVFLPNIS